MKAAAQGERAGAPGTIEAVLVSISPKLERPKWLRAPAPAGENYRELKGLIERLRLHTVCESAACPNVGRMLESAHRDLHDPGQRVHAALRILRGAERRAAAGGLRRAGARRRSCGG